MSHESLSTIHSPNGRALMEERIVTKTQKGKGVQVQNQGDADRFFDVHRIVHAEFLPQGLNINQQVYKKHLATSDALSEGEKN